MDGSSQQDPRVYFAAERTFLAWIRTGLGLIGIGFAVARFSLFLREMTTTQPGSLPHHHGLSLWAGVALVGLGVIVIVGSLFRHVRLVTELRTGKWVPDQISTSSVAFAVLLTIVGTGIACYLIILR